MYHEIHGEWINGCKVTTFPWVDNETIYFHVEYFTPGSSVSRPKWEKTVYIKDTERNRGVISSLLYTLIDYVCQMKVEKDKKYVLDF